MNRKLTFSLLAALAVIAVLAMARSASASGQFFFDFEQTLKPWALTTDSGTKVASFERRTGENGCPSLHGNSYANIKFAVGKAGAAGWMQTDFLGSGSDSVMIDFAARTEGECTTCKPVVYIGKFAATSADQFVAVSPSPGDHPKSFLSLSGPTLGGWTNYHYQTIVGEAQTIYLGVGVAMPHTMPLKGSPNPVVSVGLDCLSIDIKSNTRH